MFLSTYTLVESEYTQFRQRAKYMFCPPVHHAGKISNEHGKTKSRPFRAKGAASFCCERAHNRKRGRQRRSAGLGLTLHALVTINGEITEFLLDAEELVVLSHTVGAAERTGLDLTRVGSHGDVSDGSIFSFARTVRSHRSVTCAVSHFDGIERL